MHRGLIATGKLSRGGAAFAAVSLFCAIATPALAQEVQLVLDPAHTNIEFVLSDVLHMVHGGFKLREGNIRVDLATGIASGLVVVDAASGDSGSGARDRKMHKEILESRKYPDITITPVKIVGHLATQGGSKLEMQGVFKIHGDEHQVTLPLSVRVAGDQLFADTHFTIPYVKWGMKNPSTFILRVSDKVEIGIHASGHLTILPDGAPTS